MKKTMKMSFKKLVMGLLLGSMMACSGNTAKTDEAANNTNSQCAEGQCAQNGQCSCQQTKKKPYSKKYTNKDFYKDGVFQEDVAMAAMKDMLAYYDVPFTDFMAKEMWVTDFALGDFEHVGMGGIFWVNDPVYKYFAHAIYLLPGQMIVEHAHVKTPEFNAKHESWMVEKGWAYNFSEIGEETPNAPAIPASFGPVKSKNFTVQKVGDIIRLKKLESWHFLMAGPEGAIVAEWASYHDGNGFRSSNPKVKF